LLRADVREIRRENRNYKPSDNWHIAHRPTRVKLLGVICNRISPRNGDAWCHKCQFCIHDNCTELAGQRAHPIAVEVML